jgi:hypothetical protein
LNAGPVSARCYLLSTPMLLKTASRRNRSSVQPNKWESTEGHPGKEKDISRTKCFRIKKSIIQIQFHSFTIDHKLFFYSGSPSNAHQDLQQDNQSYESSEANSNLLWDPLTHSESVQTFRPAKWVINVLRGEWKSYFFNIKK